MAGGSLARTYSPGMKTLKIMSWSLTARLPWHVGGDLMCIFSSITTSSKWGSWGLLEGADETASPKLDSVMKWNRGNLR